MSRRIELQQILEATLGSSNVYFQPPSSAEMKYPCLVYSRSRIDLRHANNHLYAHKTAYAVTVIDANPDSEIPGRVLLLPLCSFDRHFTANNLHHDVFIIYY